MSKSTLIPAELQRDQQHLFEHAILTTVSNLYNRIKITDLYTAESELNCCFIKMASLLSVSAEPTHPADLLITARFVTAKFAPTLLRLYEQMPEPKFVMTLGGCSTIADSLTPVDHLIPVDTHIAECPLRSQTLLDAIAELHYS